MTLEEITPRNAGETIKGHHGSYVIFETSSGEFIIRAGHTEYARVETLAEATKELRSLVEYARCL